MNLFKNISSKEEEASFREWARENYKRLDPIKEVWHPIVQDECRKINEELMEKPEEFSKPKSKPYLEELGRMLRERSKKTKEYYKNNIADSHIIGPCDCVKIQKMFREIEEIHNYIAAFKHGQNEKAN